MALVEAVLQRCTRFKGSSSKPASGAPQKHHLGLKRLNPCKKSHITSFKKCGGAVVRFYTQKTSSKGEELSESPGASPPAPTSASLPQSIRNMQNPTIPSDDLGEIQFGADGVVQQRDRAPSAAASQFTARRPPTSQEEMLKRMVEIDKKSRAAKEAKELASGVQKPKAASKLPEVLAYHFYPRKWVHMVNAVACLGSFPVHAWGFYTLQPHLVAPFFAGSLVWLWWHRRVMSSTLTKLTLLPGHKQVELTSLNFFGLAKTRTVSVLAISTVLTKRAVPKTLSLEEAQKAIGMSLATTEVTFIDVNEMLVNVMDEAEAETFKQNQPGLAYRTRYAIDPDAASTFRHEHFLRFVTDPQKSAVQERTKQMFD